MRGDRTLIPILKGGTECPACKKEIDENYLDCPEMEAKKRDPTPLVVHLANRDRLGRGNDL